jgi:ATP-dependent exoDNAse (exonuclease V) alpha subunit
MDENVFPKDVQKKLEYTAITRAREQIIIVK